MVKVSLVLIVAVLPVWSFRLHNRVQDHGCNGNRGTSALKVGSPGMVRGLYTYGSPKISDPALQNPADPGGCFPGFRVVNEWNTNFGWGDVDIIPTLPPGFLNESGWVAKLSYGHPRIEMFVVDQNRRWRHKCGKFPWSVKLAVSAILHDVPTYVKRAMKYDEKNLRNATWIGLRTSIEQNGAKVAKLLEGTGWNPIGRAVVNNGRDVSHLIQEPNTKECILTFEGSDDLDDWINNVRFTPTKYCGYKNPVHDGFQDQLRKVCDTEGWQKHIRAKLGYCSSVDAVGHSLGGALATLFTACVANKDNVKASHKDYKYISWTQQEPKALPRLRN